MEEKYAIARIKTDSGESMYELVKLEFLTAHDANDFRNSNFENPDHYIIVRYFA